MTKKSEYKIRNFTPHEVVILDGENNVVAKYPTEGNVRVETEMVRINHINGIALKKVEYGETQGLPDYQIGTILIVSMVVAQANPYRDDLICPNTAPSETVRDAEGKIIGVRSFAQYKII